MIPTSGDLRYDLRDALNRAMRNLRDAEDLARLYLHDPVLAHRIREVHELLTADVLNGRRGQRSRVWKARAWDRLRLLRAAKERSA